MSAQNKLSVLLLCDFDPFNAQMVQDSIHALVSGSAHTLHCLSFRGDFPSGLDLSLFDAVLIHYSTFIYDDRYLSAQARSQLAGFHGPKAVFLHDEYKHVNRTKAALAKIGANILFTCFQPAEAQLVYGDLFTQGLKIITLLPGYVSPSLAALDPGMPAGARPIDIGYRGRRYPAWHGELGRARVVIHEQVSQLAAEQGFVVDSSVDERDRLYGKRWLAFQRSCKAVLGTESGASVIDFTGDIARMTDAHVARAPDTSFDALKANYFAAEENRIALRTISPRIFEAIACGASLILYEGRYAGRLLAGRHYLPLRSDHSNFPDIAAALRDSQGLDRMTALARAEVLLAPENQESALLSIVDRALLSAAGPERVAPLSCEAFTRAFGRYDNKLARPVLTRQLFWSAVRVHDAVVGLLPQSLGRPVSRLIRGLWHGRAR